MATLYIHTFCSAVVQARTKGLLWKTKVLEKKKATQLNLSGPQDNLNKTIIDGATVRQYTENTLLECTCIYVNVSTLLECM